MADMADVDRVIEFAEGCLSIPEEYVYVAIKLIRFAAELVALEQEEQVVEDLEDVLENIVKSLFIKK